MSAWLIKGARVVDPASGRDETADVRLADGSITEIGPGLEHGKAEVIDADGAVAAPGFVDLHTHLREPGREDEETIATASAGAAVGGYTAVCAMPNTDPVCDTSSVAEKVWALGRENGLVDVRVAGAISRGLDGAVMADIGEMVRSAARVTMFTDDGHGVQDSLFARRTMEYLVAFDAIFAEHCEDAALAADRSPSCICPSAASAASSQCSAKIASNATRYSMVRRANNESCTPCPSSVNIVTRAAERTISPMSAITAPSRPRLRAPATRTSTRPFSRPNAQTFSATDEVSQTGSVLGIAQTAV